MTTESSGIWSIISIPMAMSSFSSSNKSGLIDCTICNLESYGLSRPIICQGPRGSSSTRGSEIPKGECIFPDESDI